MKVFRISNPLYITDKSGFGARSRGYRWNHIGTPMLYTAGSIALAAWEVRVHIPNDIIPRADAYALAQFDIPNHEIIEISSFGSRNLPVDWKSNQLITKAIGDFWIEDSAHLCLKVPSAIIDSEYNYLINPLHPKISLVTMDYSKPFVFDVRTFGNTGAPI